METIKITIEGVRGCGKTSTAMILAEKLTTIGREVHVVDGRCVVTYKPKITPGNRMNSVEIVVVNK